jgi:hypothetical protein
MNNKTKTNEKFIEELNDKYNGKIKVLEKYKTKRLKLKFSCYICNLEWLTTPETILRSKHGCPACAKLEFIKKRKKSIDTFLKELVVVHNNKIILIGEYVSNKTPLKLYCNICKNEWFACSTDVIGKGTGCWECAKMRFKGSYNQYLFESRPELKSNSAKLYFIKLYNDLETFYKIGITTTTLKYRFKEMYLYNYQLISEINTTLYEAFLKEQSFTRMFKEYKYIPKHKFGGYTECFSKEIYNVMFPKGAN